MRVTGWKNTSSQVEGNTYGLRLRIEDREAVFGGERPERVQLKIGETVYELDLRDSFWRDCPEFRDNTQRPIRTLLESLDKLVWETNDPPRFEMIHHGGSQFELFLTLFRNA